jgi:hypothetical protein
MFSGVAVQDTADVRRQQKGRASGATTGVTQAIGIIGAYE